MKITSLRFVRCYDCSRRMIVNHFDAAVEGEILELPAAVENSEVIHCPEGFSEKEIEDFYKPR